MLRHQIHNTTGNVYNAFLYKKTFYEPHFHKSFELIFLQKGEMDATVDQKRYHLHAGECLLIPSFVNHSLDVKEGNDCIVIVFSPRYVESAAALFRNNEPADYRVRLDEATAQFFLRSLAAEPKESGIEGAYALQKPSLLCIKASLYAVFDAFLTQNPMQKKTRDSVLAEQLIEYLESNYQSDFTLTDLAQHLGYSYDYLSRVFNQTFRMNFKTIVNQYRCEQAMHLLCTTQATLADIATESGFQSIRSFNRVFLDTVGITPSDFRCENS